MQKQNPQISAYFAYFALTLPTMHFTHTPLFRIQFHSRPYQRGSTTLPVEKTGETPWRLAFYAKPEESKFEAM